MVIQYKKKKIMESLKFCIEMTELSGTVGHFCLSSRVKALRTDWLQVSHCILINKKELYFLLLDDLHLSLTILLSEQLNKPNSDMSKSHFLSFTHEGLFQLQIV